MNKAVYFAAALLFAPAPVYAQEAQPSQEQAQPRDQGERGASEDRDRDRGSSMREDLLERLSRSDLRDRIASAVERIEGACADDIDRYCGDITPGGGRIASCMQAYADQLSRRCQFTLRRAVNNFEQAVEGIADTCMTAVQQQCGDTDDVKQCLQQKTSALPQSCQTIVAAATHVRQALAAREQGPASGQGTAKEQGTASAQAAPQPGGATPTQTAPGRQGLRGMPVFSSDGKNLGDIVRVERAPDGKIQSVQIQVGRLLGLGEKTITIDGNKIEQLADRIKLMMNSDQVRQLPDTRSPGGAQR